MPIRQGCMPCQSTLSTSALSAHRLHARPPHIFMRAWNQRIRESARFFRVMCSHAWYRESYGERRTLLSCFARRPHSLATHASCDSVAYAEGVQKRNTFLFLSFSYFSDKRKVPLTYCYFSDRRKVHGAYCYLFIFCDDRILSRQTEKRQRS